MAEFQFRDTVRLGDARPPLRGRRRRRAGRAPRRPARRAAAPARPRRPPARPAGGLAGRRCGREPTPDDRPACTAVRDAGPSPALVAARDGSSRGPSTSRSALGPGDRPLVAAGESVVAGAPIAERLRDARLSELAVPAGERRRSPAAGSPRASCCSTGAAAGASPAATSTEPIETPVAGIVREVRPGIGHRRPGDRPRRCAGSSPWAARPAAGSTCAAWATASCGPSGLDVGLAGHHPRGRLADRRRDAHPGAGDGRPRHHRRRAGEQGAARLPGLRAPPAGGPPSAAAVRRARPRGRASGARWRARSLSVLDGARRATRSPSSPTRRRWSSTTPTSTLPVPPPDLVRVRGGDAGRPRGHVGGPRSACAGSPAASSSRPARSRFADGAVIAVPARRPRAVRLTPVAPGRSAAPSGTLDHDDRPRSAPVVVVCPDPAATSRLGAGPATRRAGRRPGLPVGRPRRRQDPPGQGVRGRPRGDRHDHLAELRAHGRVRGPAAALPPRPVPAGRRRRRPGRRAHRRAPGRRASPSSSGPSGSGDALPAARLDVRIDGSRRRAADDHPRGRHAGLRALPRGGRR